MYQSITATGLLKPFLVIKSVVARPSYSVIEMLSVRKTCGVGKPVKGFRIGVYGYSDMLNLVVYVRIILQIEIVCNSPTH